MAEQKKAPDFEALKNENYAYHYNRSDRYARRRQPPEEAVSAPTRRKSFFPFLDRFFGGNGQVKSFVLVYVVVGVVLWFFFMNRTPGGGERPKEWKIEDGHVVVTRVMKDGTNRTISVLVENRNESLWKVGSVRLVWQNAELMTNVAVELKKGDFETYILPLPEGVSDQKNMMIQVR